MFRKANPSFVFSILVLSSLVVQMQTSHGQDGAAQPAAKYRIKVAILREESNIVAENVARLRQLRAGLRSEMRIDFSLDMETVRQLDDGAVVEIAADEDEFVYSELMKLVELVQQSGFKSIRIKAIEGLQWEVFDKARYDKFRNAKPTVLTVMADLCPGCRRLLDQHWNDKEILHQLAARNVGLFFGVSSQDAKLSEFVQNEFAQQLPSLIIQSERENAQPVVLPKIPTKESVLKAIEKQLPLRNLAAKTTS